MDPRTLFRRLDLMREDLLARREAKAESAAEAAAATE